MGICNKSWWVFWYWNSLDCYFDSFGVEHIAKEIKIFIDKSIVVTYIFRMQAYDSVMCGYFCIGFIDFMLKGKNLGDFTDLFSPNNFKIMIQFETILKMGETSNIYWNLNDQQQFRLNKINEVKENLIAETRKS